jgi:PAS domain S-box-containing protein
MTERRGDEVLVLHVDDDPGFAEMAAVQLERQREQFTVETATGAEEALSVLAERRVDCVVSDYEMPGTNGLGLLRAVREHHGELPFVLFTGKGSEEIASEAISAGVDDYLQKSTGTDTYDVLANRVSNLVEGKRATDAAAESEERYHNLVDTSPASIGLFDESGELVYANDAAAELLGFEDTEAMVGRKMVEFVHREDRDLAAERFQRLHEAGESAPETEMRLVTSHGDVRHVRVASAPGVYEGEPVAQAVLRDVTALHRAETQSGADHELVRAAVDTLDDLFYILDTDGTVRLWNEQAAEVTGAGDEDLSTASPSDFVVEADVQQVADSVQRAVETGSAVVEARLRSADGGAVPYELRCRRLTDADGEVVGVAGVGRDLSERRRRERALRALNDFATDISDYDDRDEVCRRAVEAAEDVLSFDLCVVTMEEEGMLPVAAISSEMDPEGVARMSVEEGLVGLTYRDQETFVLDDVPSHDVSDPQGPYMSGVSIPVGEHGVFQAVDEERAAFDDTDRELGELLVAHCESALDRIDQEATLERQNESLEEFATIVSHDLRNPLNLLQASVDLARETGDESYLADCDEAVGTMETLIDDLLTLAREGQVVESVDPVDVGELARQAWATTVTEDATLSVASSVTVEADAGRLRQVLENLLRNSVDHGGPGVTVEVGALRDGAGFYVADDGPGIPEDQVDRVFEPGFTTSESGTGFGLRIVREMVEAHGWTVDVIEAEDGGARFEVSIGG